MSRNFKHIVLGLAAGVVLVIFLGGFGPAGVSGTSVNNAYKQMGVYEEVLQKIQADYVTVPNLHEVTTGSLHGLLDSLDSDSAYLTPAEYKEYLAHENDGNAQVGLIVSERGGDSSIGPRRFRTCWHRGERRLISAPRRPFELQADRVGNRVPRAARRTTRNAQRKTDL